MIPELLYYSYLNLTLNVCKSWTHVCISAGGIPIDTKAISSSIHVMGQQKQCIYIHCNITVSLFLTYYNQSRFIKQVLIIKRVFEIECINLLLTQLLLNIFHRYF